MVKAQNLRYSSIKRESKIYFDRVSTTLGPPEQAYSKEINTRATIYSPHQGSWVICGLDFAVRLRVRARAWSGSGLLSLLQHLFRIRPTFYPVE